MRRSLRILPALVGAFLVLAVLQPADAAITRTISIAASPSAAITGATVTFKGTLSKSPRGSTVKLQHKVGTSWVTSKTTRTTTTTGTYATTLALPSKAGNNYYRTVAPATSTRATAISRTLTVAVLSKVTATLTASFTTVTAGDQTLLQGTVTPSSAGTLVDIQRKESTTWTSEGITSISSTGTFSKVVTVTSTAQYRAHIARTGFRAEAYSPAVLITTTPAGPVITTSSLPDAHQGVPYSTTLTAAGNPAGTWGATGLPDQGLSLNPSTGEISGTPTGATTLALHVTFTQTSTGHPATPVDLSLTITPPPPPVILTSHLPDGAALTAYAAQLYVSGNVPGTWSVSGLPSGITYDASSGAISGSTLLPTDVSVTINFTQTAGGLVAVQKTLSLHIGSVGSSTTPTLAAAGGQFSCRIDASRKLWCWGYDESGELGDGGSLASDPPGVVTPTQVGSATDWSSLTTGSGPVTKRHACALRGTDGYCWGSDLNGELGSSVTSGAATSPVAISGSHSWSQLSAGFNSTCGVTTGGELWCWGKNDVGQLGVAGGDQDVPVRVGTDSDWSQVSIGATSACAVKGGGQLYCWGLNDRGALGTGNRTSSTVPVQVSSATAWSQVSVGPGYACGVKVDGTAYCWGPSTSGELGNGKFTNSTTSDEESPKQLGGLSWTSVSAGGATTCGVKSGGQLWCWGANALGQVGDASNTARGFPVRIGTAVDWLSVSVGDSHTCGVKAGTEIWCWGNNAKGELGSSTAPSASSNVPVKVVG